MIQPQIIDKPAFEIIGFETRFIHALSPDCNTGKAIGGVWDKLIPQLNGIANRAGEASYGVITDLSESERTHPDELLYIAGAPVTSTEFVPDGMKVRPIPACKYAVFTHRGPVEKIGELCFQIYREWLPGSEFEHAGIADVEIYDHRFNCEGDSEMDYWVSIVPESNS